MVSAAGTGRDLDLLPKAHLHLHFTGSLDAATLAELAAEAGIELPEHLLDTEALSVPATTRGWFRFQRSYDMAR
ncbi:MAG: adenosine deaminase, partial [Actinomycetia bacterium]|nr:adenosine deaminase [Actinomycetes bacterium]